jgi:peptide methionine sulfoxide reductase MsrA
MTSGQLPFYRVAAPQFHYAEEHHQQYLAKTPNGCCGIGGWEGFLRSSNSLA